MKLETILCLSALAGALTFTSAAHADPDRPRHPRWSDYDDRTDDLDVIARARLSARRGVVELDVTPGMRRDGLQLWTDARALSILSVELIYSDGRVTELGRAALRGRGDLLTIQRGRPAGLRQVRVAYAAHRADRRAVLALVQIHDGDGYTDEDDLRDPERGTYRSYPRQDRGGRSWRRGCDHDGGDHPRGRW